MKVVGSGPNVGKSLYQLAFDAAVRASHAQFDRLLTDFASIVSTESEPDWNLDVLNRMAELMEKMRDYGAL
jgi:hypothetical protein